MGLLSELRRRNVFRTAIAYLVIAWIVLQVGDILAPALRLDESVNTALVFFLILGFPIALFFAWAYELTPDGIKLEKHVDRSLSITHVTGRKLDYFIIAGLLLALSFFVVDKWMFDPSRDAQLVQATKDAVDEQAAGAGTTGDFDNTIVVDEGWRFSWWINTERNDNLASLHDDPRYEAIIARVRSQMAEQLARVREREDGGKPASAAQSLD